MKSRFLLLLVLLLVTSNAAAAQTTVFTYQGKLADNGTPANGHYDFQFSLFDALSGGAQQGTNQKQRRTLLVTHNDKGEIEGVKYDRVTVVLINAVREQQHIIEQQQRQIEALKILVCSTHHQAEVCKSAKER